MSYAPVISELRRFGQRLRAMSFFHGLALLITAAVAAILIIIAVDYCLHLPPAGRIILLAISLLVIAWLLIRRIVLPMLQKIPLPFLAALIEQAFPQFHDRLRSTIDFSQEPVPGSEAMKNRVIAETSEMFEQIDVRRAISLKPLYQSLAAAFIALLAILLLATFTNPGFRHLALDRLLHPFDSPAWPKTVQIDLLDALPVRIPVGQSLNIHMKLARGDRASRKAILFYQLNAGPVEQQYMTRQADGSYADSIDTRLDTAATGQLKTWITAGDDSVHLPPVAIVPRLAVQSITAQIDPPPYAHLPPTTADLSATSVVATIGSQVTLNVHFNKPLGSAAPSIEALDGSAPPAKWRLSQNSREVSLADSATSTSRLSANEQAQANWTLATSLRFHLHATDADGFPNAAAEEYQIIAKPDQLPVIQIENPRRNEERTPDAVIPLQISASDDFGIAAVNLQIALTPSHASHLLTLLTNSAPVPTATWTQTESSPDEQRYRLDYPWSLSPLNLSPGDTLEYHATAQDNYALPSPSKVHGPAVESAAPPLRHPPVSSNLLRITIITQQQLSDHIAEQMRQIAQAVSQTRTEQTRTAQETQTLAHDTAAKPKFDPADRAILNRLADQQGSHAAQTKQLADQLSNLLQQLQENRSPNDDLKQTASDAANLLNQAAENPMKQSAAALSELQNYSAAPAQRNNQLSQTLSQQNQSAEQLQRALDRLGSAGSLDQTIQQVANLLKAQQAISKETESIGQSNLGKTPDQMSPADQKRLAANSADQKSLAQHTAEAMARMAAQAKALSNTDPDTASALSKAAASADQQQISPSQQHAADSISQNQQSDAQSAQQQAELGLQTILSDLHEAQRQKLAELSRHLADLQTQLARLVRRQATHNLDNLNLQGPTAPKGIHFSSLRGLAASAARSPSLPNLTTAQEQTHRNTRDIAADADKFPAVSEVAGLLLQSADKMERAAVLLEQNQLPQAYDPPQSDALSLLLSAQKKLDAIKSALDQKLADESRQNLRAAYVKIKSAQQLLNDQTQAIAQSPRLPDGSLSRLDAIHLLQLPPQQQKLADQIAALNDRLSALGGIVYLWANNDIHDAMTTASTLHTLPTLPTLLTLQTQIITNLDAMIQSLAVEPKQQEFAQRPSGGPGGGSKGKQKTQLPSEAELRLLKQFEQNIKTQTAASTPTQVQSLASLGQRQEQLRSLLNRLLQKASQGQTTLPPEPPNKNMLPEEKSSNSDDDLANQLLTEKPSTGDSDDQSIPLLGNRMARAGQRLAINHDPGQTTQTIEQNILKGLDQLIQSARNQQAQSSPENQQQQEEQQNPQITKNPQQQLSQSSTPSHASSPARTSNVTGSAQTQTDLSDDIHQNMRQWGGLSDRQRQAVLEGASDTVIQKYKSLVDDYYRTLAEQK